MFDIFQDAKGSIMILLVVFGNNEKYSRKYDQSHSAFDTAIVNSEEKIEISVQGTERLTAPHPLNCRCPDRMEK